MAGVGSPLWIANQPGTRSDGKSFATVLFFNGGMGATSIKDGSSVMSWPSNISPTPIEIAERDFPLFFNRKSLLSDSGGAGLHRGGLGEEISFINKHAFPLSIVFLTERLIVSAPGIAGGESGKLGAVYINGKIIDSRKPYILLPGDEVLLRTPGGGGYGEKNQRNRDLINFDLQHGYISTEA
jgi:N-methylhydantoinase B